MYTVTVCLTSTLGVSNTHFIHPPSIPRIKLHAFSMILRRTMGYVKKEEERENKET
jgi:hypothetical protein